MEHRVQDKFPQLRSKCGLSLTRIVRGRQNPRIERERERIYICQLFYSVTYITKLLFGEMRYTNKHGIDA